MDIDEILGRVSFSKTQFERQGIIANIILIDERTYEKLIQNKKCEIQRMDGQPTIFGCKLIAVNPMTGIYIAAGRI